MRAAISRKVSSSREDTPDNTAGRLTYGHVWLSGVFYRLYEKEIAGMQPDFLTVTMISERGKAAMKIKDQDMRKKKLKTISREYEDYYYNWKEVIMSI